jgi:xanthine dehydrogenase YagS FAD-binding subunit
LKAFAYVNAANERDAIAALSTETAPFDAAQGKPASALARRILPMAGGMDLLGLMKDYIVSPDRIVSIRNLDQTITSADSGVRIGAAVKLIDVAEHATVRKLFPALATAAEGVGTPQIRNMGTVGGNIMQRPRCWYFRNEEFNCLKKGGARCFAVEGENQFHAIFGDGPCHIVHPSSLAVPVIAYGGRFRVVGPSGAREIDAGEFFQMPNVNLYGESVLQANEIITHIVLPAPGQRSASYEVRFKQSHDWPLAMASVNLMMDGQRVRSARIVLGAVAPVPWRVPAAERVLAGKTITEAVAVEAATAALAGAKPMSGNAYKIQIAKTAVKRAVLRAAGLRA